MGKITTVNKEEERFPVVQLDPYHPFIEYLLSASGVTLSFSTIGALGFQDILSNDYGRGVKDLQKWMVEKLLELNPFDDLRTTTGKKVVANTMKWGTLIIRVSDGYKLTRRIEFKLHYSPRRKLHTIHLALPILDIDLSENGLIERYAGVMSDILGEAKDIDFNKNPYEESAKLWEQLPGRNKDGKEKDLALNNVYFKLKSFINKASSLGISELKVNGNDFDTINDLLEPFMVLGNKPYNPMFRGYENVPLTWWMTLTHGQLNYQWVDDHAIFTLTKG